MGSAGTGVELPAIGSSFGGGFFAGAVSETQNGVPTYLLVVAPRATGYFGTAGGFTQPKYRTSPGLDSGALSTIDGATNTANIANADHPAALLCADLVTGGFSDWYLPALFELEIAYYNLKPTTQSNTGSVANGYAVPATTGYTSGVPGQTAVSAFQAGGAEAFLSEGHWTSTQYPYAGGFDNFAFIQRFNDGFIGPLQKDTGFGAPARAFRKVLV